jgi:hypothetical protein
LVSGLLEGKRAWGRDASSWKEEEEEASERASEEQQKKTSRFSPLFFPQKTKKQNSMVTPSKVDEDAELASKHITVGECAERKKEKKKKKQKRDDFLRELLTLTFQKNKKNKKKTGRWVSYDDGRTSRQGKVTQILKTPEETAHPPIVVYECENKKGEMKEYKNKPSRLEIYHHK